jgi:sugar-specific transcriptional regulator TrmB
MDYALLEEIGLTKGEAKVYAALIEGGEMRTGKISTSANVSNSKVHKILERLEEKGLVGHMLHENIRYYVASEPKRILDYLKEQHRDIERQENKVKSILPSLENSFGKNIPMTQAVLYKGFKAIMNVYRGLLEELKEGDTYYVIGASYGDNLKGVREFFINYHRQRSVKRIKAKILWNENERSSVVPTAQLYSEIRFLPKVMAPKMIVLTYKNKTFQFYLTKDPMGIYIKSREIAESFQDYFHALWKIAKK